MSNIHIPDGVEQKAISTITAMTERGLAHPDKLHRTCLDVARIILAKWDITDRKIIRYVTNTMINKAYDVTERL